MRTITEEKARKILANLSLEEIAAVMDSLDIKVSGWSNEKKEIYIKE